MKSNLRIAFPLLDSRQLDALAGDIWGHFGAVMAEYPHLNTLSRGGSPPYTDIVMDREVKAIIDGRRPAVYVTAHLGNWELVAATIANTGTPLSVIYGPQSNPVLDRLILKQRGTLGYRLVAKTNGVRKLLRELRAGRSVGLLPDQRVDSGEPLPFFGRPAPTTTSPAWLSLRFGCPLIPVQVERTGSARYRVVFHRPLAGSAGRAAVRAAV